MKNKPSLKDILTRKDISFLREYYCPNLEFQRIAEIEFNVNIKLRIDYCIIDPDRSKPKETIVLLTGFGSGWTGITMLGFHLARMGYKICMPSLPGYGNSCDYAWRERDSEVDFALEGDVLSVFVKTVLGPEKVHFVGHSMGAAIATRLAQNHPEFVKSLSLINPAGFKKRNSLELSTKFLANGLLHRMTFRKDPIWAEISKHLPKQKGPFTKDRRPQRWRELRQSCGDSAIEYLKRVPVKIPILYVSCEKDFVIPYDRKFMEIRERIFPQHLYGVYHNSTMYGSEGVADRIDTHVKKNCYL